MVANNKFVHWPDRNVYYAVYYGKTSRNCAQLYRITWMCEQTKEWLWNYGKPLIFQLKRMFKLAVNSFHEQKKVIIILLLRFNIYFNSVLHVQDHMWQWHIACHSPIFSFKISTKTVFTHKYIYKFSKKDATSIIYVYIITIICVYTTLHTYIFSTSVVWNLTSDLSIRATRFNSRFAWCSKFQHALASWTTIGAGAAAVLCMNACQ